MLADDIITLFGTPADTGQVTVLFSALNTLRRPRLPDDGQASYYDWVLVRRKGIELGFVDSEYQAANNRFRWGRGELLLCQAYFYSGFDDVQPFTGELPFGLTFADSRELARVKLAAYETTRHAYRSDTWDVEGYRLTVTYAGNGASIDRIACRMLAAPIPRQEAVTCPEIGQLAKAFGFTTGSPEFLALWPEPLADDDYQAAREDGEIDLTQTHGATLYFAKSRSGPIFRSMTLHRNRDMESTGWAGELPQGLDFEDSPEILFQKISVAPVQQADSALTGHAVWHFDDYTLHVLYSNVDNRLLRVKMHERR